MKTASPTDFVIAWNVISSGTDGYSREEIKRHPIPADTPDPTFHRDNVRSNGGWHRAVEILNPRAISAMRAHFATEQLAVPAEVDAAWDRTVSRLDERAIVRACIDNAMVDAWAEGADTKIAFAQHAIDRLTTFIQDQES